MQACDGFGQDYLEFCCFSRFLFQGDVALVPLVPIWPVSFGG